MESKSSFKTERQAYLVWDYQTKGGSHFSFLSDFHNEKCTDDSPLHWYYMLEQYLFHNEFSFAMNSKKTPSGIIV